jgi:hypothetical protein
MDDDDFPTIEATVGTLKRQMEASSGWSDFVLRRAEETRQAESQAPPRRSKPRVKATGVSSRPDRQEPDIAEYRGPCDTTQEVRERAAESCCFDPD